MNKIKSVRMLLHYVSIFNLEFLAVVMVIKQVGLNIFMQKERL